LPETIGNNRTSISDMDLKAINKMDELYRSEDEDAFASPKD
jgi:hypothetical protein